MRSLLFACAALFGLGGCAGLKISTIKSEEVINARQKGPALHGYVVYEPVVVVELSVKDVCVAKDDKGNCKEQETRCAASQPFLLPDYTKPYVVSSKSGFGKAGVDVTIADGWRLGGFKDNSDNTALLGTIEKLLGIKSAAERAKGNVCKEPGLYRLKLENGNLILDSLKLY